MPTPKKAETSARHCFMYLPEPGANKASGYYSQTACMKDEHFCYTCLVKYRAVLFDMDGVILDSEPLHVAAFQAILQRYGHPLSESDYKMHFAGKTDETGFKSYFKFLNESVDLPVIMDDKAHKYLELAGDQLIPYPGIVQLIRELSKKVPLALVTGSLRAEADAALKAFDIADCFKVVIAAEDINHSKPDPEGYKKAMSALEVNPHECAVIEDSPSGIEAAIAAGADCIAITNTHEASNLSRATKIVTTLSISDFE
jgi:beta-phosphoglucomutase